MFKKQDIKNPSFAPLSWPDCQQGLGREVHALRLARGIKQSDLARQAGVSRSTLSGLENAGRATLETLLRVLFALDALDQVAQMIANLAQVREAAGATTLDDLLAEETRKAAPPVRQRVRRRLT